MNHEGSMSSFCSVRLRGFFKYYTFKNYFQIRIYFVSFFFFTTISFVLTSLTAFTFLTGFSFLQSLHMQLASSFVHSALAKNDLSLSPEHFEHVFVSAVDELLLHDQQLRLFPSSFFHSSLAKSVRFLILVHSEHFFSATSSLSYTKFESR